MSPCHSGGEERYYRTYRATVLVCMRRKLHEGYPLPQLLHLTDLVLRGQRRHVSSCGLIMRLWEVSDLPAATELRCVW